MDTATMTKIEAQPIWDLDGDRILGYWARGSHLGTREMLAAIEQYSGPLSPDELQRLDAATQRHCYARVVGDWSEGERRSMVQWGHEPGPGAFPVTVWEY
jgi:hypothetical protein